MSSCRRNSPRGFTLRYEVMTPSRFINFHLKLRILTTLRRDIQCESLFRRSQPVLQSTYPTILLYYYILILLSYLLYKNRLCYARYEKPLKNHSLEVAKNYVETYSSSNAAALYPEERVTKINLVTLLNYTENSMKGVMFYIEL